jgi:hypothetical protein
MEIEEGRVASADAGRRAGPSAAAADLMAAADPERHEPEPDAQSRWVLPIGRYMRTATSEFQGVRYG